MIMQVIDQKVSNLKKLPQIQMFSYLKGRPKLSITISINYDFESQIFIYYWKDYKQILWKIIMYKITTMQLEVHLMN